MTSFLKKKIGICHVDSARKPHLSCVIAVSTSTYDTFAMHSHSIHAMFVKPNGQPILDRKVDLICTAKVLYPH